MKVINFVFIISLLLFSFSIINKPTPYLFPSLEFFPKMPKAAFNEVTNEGAELGRHLFYDPILSANNSISCSSCHQQASAFSDSNKRFSHGINSKMTSRNTLPLFNLAWYPAYFWDGRATSIEMQVFHPLQSKNEMNINWKFSLKKIRKNKIYVALFNKAFPGKAIDSNLVCLSIAQFLRTLISYESKYDQVLSGKKFFTKDEYEGFVLVNDQTKGDCIHCHNTDGDALSTNLIFSNNGLDLIDISDDFKDKGRGEITKNKNDYGKFKVPSLRNLAFTAPYMHDGRFKTLEEVLDFYSEGINSSPTIDSKMEYAHQGGIHLSNEEKKKIISFLLTMSDSVFIRKKEFSNPF